MNPARRTQAAKGATGARFEDATIDDLDQALVLEQACYPPESAYSRAEYRYCLSKAIAVNLKLRERPDALTAFAGAFLHRGWKTGNVYTVNVHPDARGRGLGRALMDALEARMRDAGMERSILEVSVVNEPAIRLYEGCGYAQIERLKDYYTTYPHPDAFRYEKLL